MRDLTHHQNRQTLNQNTDFTVESIIYPVGPGAQLGASPSITRSATAQHRERPGYLLVVGELRFALSGQRVGPVLSHGPLLRWHGFHQGAIYPRLGAHAPRIPIMREIFFRFPSTKKSFIRRQRAARAPVVNPWLLGLFLLLSARCDSSACARCLIWGAAHTVRLVSSLTVSCTAAAAARRNTSARALQNKTALGRRYGSV